MKTFQVLKISFFFIFFTVVLNAQSDNHLISEFERSELCGTYNVEFEQLNLLIKDFVLMEAEGIIDSRIYKKPEGKSNFEIYSSYEKELKNAGFDILLSCSLQKCNGLKKAVKKEYFGSKTIFGNRIYQKTGSYFPDKEYPAGFNEFYISAKKDLPEATYYFLFMIGSHKPLYSVDVIKAAPMEPGTVSLSPELLKSKIEEEGKIAIYDLHFDTDSDVLKAGYEPIIKIISDYLNASQDLTFYVVGHTDDSGDPDYNLSLSGRRAATVAAVLTTEYGISEDRLRAVGVGPFAPIQSNKNDAGRSMNRRVELVIR